MLIPFDKLTRKYDMKINGILHIGAHKCEELKMYNKYGILNDKIIWIEANPKLVEKMANKNKSVIIKNIICCDTDIGKTKLNIANNGQSSSILGLGTHAQHYPNIEYVDFIEVQNGRIDTMYAKDNIPPDFANFLNIDIQGAELLALKGMGVLLTHFEYIYTEVNREYVYDNCSLISDVDDYLSKFNFKRVETLWTDAGWGDALYVKPKNYGVLKNVRCSREIWNIKGIKLQDALDMASSDPRVKALHWYNQDGGDGRVGGVKGWYQGAGGDVGVVSNDEWDTIIIKQKCMAFDIGANVGLWSNANIHNYDKIISVEASPITFERLKHNCENEKIKPLNYAICDNDGMDITFFQAENDTLSTINKEWLESTHSRFHGQKYNEIVCKTKTLDNLISEYGKPDLIKIDVEGGEFECIKSLTHKVDCLCFEWASETNDITFKCLDYLQSLGFNKFYIQKHDTYTFLPKTLEYYELCIAKENLLRQKLKKDWGMIWCR